MLFSSQPFLILFLPLALVLYYSCAHSRNLRALAMVIASFAFYAWWDPRFVPLLLSTITVNWLIAKAYARIDSSLLVVLGVAFNLAVLGFFKYANFAAENVLQVFGHVHEPWSIILPLGISFFTFQQISYLLDLKRGQAPSYGLLDYCAYVSFFPQLIAGPIVRHNELIPQFSLPPLRPETVELAGRGLVLFILGLIKKVFFADELAPIADTGFDAALAEQGLAASTAWAASLAYSLQLYFDFSAYSDMAIGLGGLFGLRLPINFNAPYQALDIRDFWRRWHITLSGFLRDYLYIPLGGSRGGLAKTCLIVIVTMLLCGLWHGAGWTFIVWGAVHGIAICINRIWANKSLSLPKPIAWLLTMFFVVLAWIIFRAETFDTAMQMYRGLMNIHDGASLLDGEDYSFILIGILFAVIGPTNAVLAAQNWILNRKVAIAAAFALVVVCLRVGQGRGLEFIYFQF